MLRISLINMPFGIFQPSLALTQLKQVLEQRFPGQVSVDVHYLNLELVDLIGFETYDYIAYRAYTKQFGEWFFRQVAFPDQPDNTEAFFRRQFPEKSPERENLKRLCAEVRPKLSHILGRKIEEHTLDRADMVGFTLTFSQTVPSIAMARLLKERNPKLQTLVGGPNCVRPMGGELIQKIPSIDYLFEGAALKSMPALVEARLAGRPEAPIRGIHSRTTVERKLKLMSDGCDSSSGEFLGPNEAPPDPDYTDYLAAVKKSLPNLEIELLFETSRGCWWGEIQHCTFCAMNDETMEYEAIKPERAVALIQNLYKRYPEVRRFSAVDNILPREYIKEVFPRLETPKHTHLWYEIKANLKEPEVAVLAKARVLQLQPGIESLSSSTLKLMKKGTTSFQNLRLMMWTQLYGIALDWNLLIGFPGEDQRTLPKYLRDIPLLTHLMPPIGVYQVRFDRDSPYTNNPSEFGLKLEPFDFYRLIYPFDEKTITNLAYWFMDTAIDAPYLDNVAEWLPQIREQVAFWQNRWKGMDGHPRAILSLRRTANGPVVFDSRGTEPKEHTLGAGGVELLELLSQARQREDLEKWAEGHPERLAEFERLREAGLFFEEDERYLSLVLPREPVEITVGGVHGTWSLLPPKPAAEPAAARAQTG